MVFWSTYGRTWYFAFDIYWPLTHLETFCNKNDWNYQSIFLSWKLILIDRFALNGKWILTLEGEGSENHNYCLLSLLFSCLHGGRGGGFINAFKCAYVIYGWLLVVFSHGLGCARFTYSQICYDLASYGFVVIAPEHR